MFANTTLADVYFNIKYQSCSGCDSNTVTPRATFGEEISFALSKTLLPPATVQRIPAHSFVLAISSPVFEAMFYGPLASNNQRRMVSTPRNSWPSTNVNTSTLPFTPVDDADESRDLLLETEYAQERDRMVEGQTKTSTKSQPQGPSSSQSSYSNLPIGEFS